MARPLLTAGDLLRTADALAVRDPAVLRRLAGQLGLLLPHVAAPARGTGVAAGPGKVPLPPPPAPPPPPPPPPPPTSASPAPQAGSGTSGSLPGGAVAVLLQPLPALGGAGGAPPWHGAGARQMAKGPVDPPTPLDPLFQPASRRALGAALAARQVAEGDIDLERLHRALAGGVAPQRLPRLPLWTLRHGLQLLVDLGPQMQPWQRDVQDLRALLLRLLGEAQLQQLGFDGDPLHRCQLPGLATPLRWPPPPPGRPLLVLSDLGIARATGPAALLPHWRGLARAAAEAGTPVRVLVPHARSRWPRGLPASLQLLAWDRRTSVASLRRLLAP